MTERRASEIKKRLEEIPDSCYSEEYFLSESEPNEFERFKKGGSPRVYSQAFKHVPKDIDGPFLDIGCGRGELVIYLARRGEKAWGIDYSQAAIRLCREILKNEQKSTQTLAKFQLASCTKLPFKDNTFRGVFLLDVVEHLTPKQLKLTLKEAKRVLKKQGILIIHTNNKYFEKFVKLFIAASYQGIKCLFRPKKTLQETASSPYEFLHINYLTGTQLRRLLKEIGFKAKIEYVKPRKKTEIKKFLSYREKWKNYLFFNVGWLLLNSPMIKFISPTFWVMARKN